MKLAIFEKFFDLYFTNMLIHAFWEFLENFKYVQ